MKKFCLLILLLCFVSIPFHVFAQEKQYKTLNLDEALTEEEIEHDFSNYTETDEQAIIYLFRGNGCTYCRSFLTFLNSIVDDYGKYFKVVSYEVWYDSDNAKLMNQVANFLNTTAEGVPFIVIGDQVFPGYSSQYDDSIKKAIMNQYDSKNSYDVLNEMSKESSATKETKSPSSSGIILNLIFIIISTIILVVVNNKNTKKIEDNIASLSNEIKKVNKKTNKNT